MKDKIKVQFGTSHSGDFENNTWIFEMDEKFSLMAGEFAIVPKDEFNQLIQQPTVEQKNVYQLFIGKVSEILGTAKTMQLLKESHETFNEPE